MMPAKYKRTRPYNIMTRTRGIVREPQTKRSAKTKTCICGDPITADRKRCSPCSIKLYRKKQSEKRSQQRQEGGRNGQNHREDIETAEGGNRDVEPQGPGGGVRCQIGADAGIRQRS